MKVGDKYLVPVARFSYEDKVYTMPVYDNLHDDKESGQNYKHLHIDFRFIKEFRPEFYPKIRVNLNEVSGLIVTMEDRRCYRIEHTHLTPVFSLNEKAFNYGNLASGHCIHKGYDLKKESVDDNRCIVCPLHGLRYRIDHGKYILIH